jgi:urease accessory protein
MGVDAVLLMLADSRLPAGGHAHSGGIEAAVTAGLVSDVDSLGRFLGERLETAGLVAAGLAAWSARAVLAGGTDWSTVDAEADARTPSPAQRAASRGQGRALVRVARVAWPSPVWAELPPAPHHPVALGVAAATASVGPARDGPVGAGGAGVVAGAARVAAYLSVSGAASAAVRLCGLDPLAVQAVVARLGSTMDGVARVAVEVAAGPVAELPCPAAPRLDLLAELHARAEVRLFAS